MCVLFPSPPLQLLDAVREKNAVCPQGNAELALCLALFGPDSTSSAENCCPAAGSQLLAEGIPFSSQSHWANPS